jgi:hypothetical protein
MLYIRFPIPLKNVQDLLHERRFEVSHETVRFWWQRFGHVRSRDPPEAGERHKSLSLALAPRRGVREVTAFITNTGVLWTTKGRCWRPVFARLETRTPR